MGRFDRYIAEFVEDDPRAQFFQEIGRHLRNHIQEQRLLNSSDWLRRNLMNEVTRLKTINSEMEAQLNQQLSNVDEMHMYNADLCDQLYWLGLDRDMAFDRANKCHVVAWTSCVVCFFFLIVLVITICSS